VGLPRVQLPELRCGPDIGAVEAHVDRQIAQDEDAELLGQLPQQAPLAVEQPLQEGVIADLVGQLGAGLGQRLGAAPGERFLPFRPGAPTMSLLERGKEGPVVEPARLGLDEGLELARQVGAGSGGEVAEGLAQQRLLPGQ
jgi:hypothetical protein